MIKIFGKASSINVRKVLWACAELGIHFEREDWGSGFRATQTPQFIAMNPNGLIPVIRDDDFVLWESNTIIRYLAAKFDGVILYPLQVQQRARIDQWIDWQASELNRAWSYAFMALVRKSPTHRDDEQIAASITAWSKYMAILGKQLEKTGGYVAGDAFTLADIPIGLSVHRWFATPLSHPDLPTVSAYYDLLTQRPAYREHGRNGIP